MEAGGSLVCDEQASDNTPQVGSPGVGFLGGLGQSLGAGGIKYKLKVTVPVFSSGFISSSNPQAYTAALSGNALAPIPAIIPQSLGRYLIALGDIGVVWQSLACAYLPPVVISALYQCIASVHWTPR